MTHQQSESRPDRTAWILPAPQESTEAFTYFWKRNRRPVVRTIAFKLHGLTKRKIRILLDAFVYLHNLIATILQLWHEDCQHPREDGAVAEIFKTQKKGVYGRFRSRTLSSAISKQLAAPLQTNQSFVTYRLHEGAFRACAQMLVNWAQKTANLLVEGRKNTVVLNERVFYDGWTQLEQAYRRAMSVVASLGFEPDDVDRLRPDQLERRSKNEARWILQRLRPESELRQVLAYVEALLGDEPSAQQREANSIEHPWLTKPSGKGLRHRRGVRESWFLQRILDAPDSSVLLGNLDQNEREDFRDELRAMLLYIERATALIATFDQLDHSEQDGSGRKRTGTTRGAREHQQKKDESRAATLRSKKGARSQKQKTVRASEERALQSLLEIFLYAKPPRFPVVQRVRLADEHDESGQLVYYDTQEELPKSPQVHRRLRAPEMYRRFLSWFRLNSARKNAVDRFRSDKEEARVVQGMFKWLRALKLPSLQPLDFIGTTRPRNYRDGRWIQAQYRDFALLFERVTKEDTKGRERESIHYVLAVFTHKRLDPLETQIERDEKARRAVQTAAYQQRRQQNPMYYVNFPYTPFEPPATAGVTLFPLECGNRYHEEQFLRPIIERQRSAQERAYMVVNQARDKEIPIEKCLPQEAPFASAKVTCRWTELRQPTFFLHATVTEPISELQPIPLRVMGVTFHDDRCVCAVLELNGIVRTVNDIFIPRYLNPRYGAKRNSDNYIYWIANAIVDEALWWQAYIGIEDVSWKKRQISVSHAVNRRVLSMPVRRLTNTISHKARLAGLMEPRLISDVSPVYDCANCRRRLPRGTRTLVNEWLILCPSCHTQQKLDRQSAEQQCSMCNQSLPSQSSGLRLEQFFSCNRCYAQPQLARHNIAIVVAQKTLVELTRHYRNALAKAQQKQISNPAVSQS